jgi:hypothetical protein
MTVFKHLLNFYINSSIHVALAVCSLTLITLLEFDVPWDMNLLLFVFFASVTGYNFVKYFGIAKFHYRHLAIPIVIGRLKIIQVFSFFCFLLMVFYALKLPLKTFLCMVGFGTITFFYAIPFLPKRFFVDKQQNLRSIAGLKIYLIALVWSGVTVFVPLINDNLQLGTEIFITGIQRYIYVIVLMFPFEIRDLRFDSLKLSTIPQKIGIKVTKIVGSILAIIVFLLDFFKESTNIIDTIILGIVLSVTVFLLIISRKDQNRYFSSFWVEGIPIFWLALLLLFFG